MENLIVYILFGCHLYTGLLMFQFVRSLSTLAVECIKRCVY